MKLPVTNDNIYPIGTEVFEKSNPTIRLKIVEYKSRVYYCVFIDEPKKAEIPLFEREITQK